MTDAEAYSRVPYPGLAFPQTHPDRLALLATLHGLDPAPPDAARVLEVGCADGLNLVAMAGHAPGLHATGFDLVDPALGRQAAAELGLANVELEQGDLLDARDRGEFDYVVAHGVYGWVTAPARDALMALIARALAPHGVAFISFNALPGARMRTMLREMVLLHAGEGADAGERIARGRELYGFLAPWAENRPDAYGAVLAAELGRLTQLSTPVLAHDDLAERYEPLWLRDVAAHAVAHGLRYLADADPSELQEGRQPPGVDAQLDVVAGGDRVRWEQYADLLAGRTFRQALLCRAEAPLDDAIDPARLARLWFGALEHTGIGDADAVANGSAGPAAVAQLALVRPRMLGFEELRDALGGVDAGALAAGLWRAFRAGEIELSAAPPRHATAAGERPEASPVARWQAARGPELTSLRHDPVRLDDPLGLALIRLCDSTRDRAALADALVAGAPGDAPARERFVQRLDANLDGLVKLAMLRA